MPLEKPLREVTTCISLTGLRTGAKVKDFKFLLMLIQLRKVVIEGMACQLPWQPSLDQIGYAFSYCGSLYLGL